MSITTVAHINLRGTAREALEFYRSVFGGEGSTVVQDLAPAGWTPLYGMLTDRLGVTWVLDVAVEYGSG